MHRERRVLVVDDEENIRRMLELHLGREGYKVLCAADGDEALDRLLAEPGIGVVLCDLVMPRMGGIELLEAIAERGLSARVIIMSAHANTETALAAVQKGAFDYVAKPFRPHEVIFRLKRAEEQAALQAEVGRLKEAIGEQSDFAGIIGRSQPMQAVFQKVRKVADYKTTVLLAGESGTGKELVARALHFNSSRRKGRFIPLNCGAIPENLLESELFGHVRGAFTDATRTRKGLFEEASGGTIFLDEVGELPLALQVKLLRVLQEEEIRKVGDTRPVQIDVRVVAATVRDLSAEVQAGRFRSDLFYRLNVFQIVLPPLRERQDDVPLLVDHFVGQFNRRLGTSIEGVEPAALRLMVQHGWPGNVRELENCVERAMVLADGPRIGEADLTEKIRESRDRIRMTLAGGELSIKKMSRLIEEELIDRALEKTGGNRTRAAELLEISHRALLYKIKEYKVTR